MQLLKEKMSTNLKYVFMKIYLDKFVKKYNIVLKFKERNDGCKALSLKNWTHQSKQGNTQVVQFWFFSIVLNLVIENKIFYD